MFCSKLIPSHTIYSTFDQIQANFSYIFEKFHNVFERNMGNIFLIPSVSFTHFLMENNHVIIQGLDNNIF